jgi:hypothetical protein
MAVSAFLRARKSFNMILSSISYSKHDVKHSLHVSLEEFYNIIITVEKNIKVIQ